MDDGFITRIRIEAEGNSQRGAEDALNAGFRALQSELNGLQSEFGEEVYETFTTDHGSIRWKGRRVVKYEPPSPPPTWTPTFTTTTNTA